MLGACCVPGNFVHTANLCGKFSWTHYTEEKTESQAQGHHFSVVTRKKKKKVEVEEEEGHRYQHQTRPCFSIFPVPYKQNIKAQRERGIFNFQLCYLIFIMPRFDFSDTNLL